MNPRTEVAVTAPRTSVFQPAGDLDDEVDLIPVHHKRYRKQLIDILVAAPKDAGTYPVAIFLHGFMLENRFYRQILKHVASFGFIMVAPQFPQFRWNMMDQADTEDIDTAAEVTDWLTEGLPPVLPNGVKANLSKLALAGHSRGGHTAFALVLGHGKTNLKFSAIIGVDPVAGQDESSQISPKILTHKPSSFNITMPALVIGTGLGEAPKKIIEFKPLHWEFSIDKTCAPKNVNHRDFYHECKPPCYYFVTKDYGHLDMLDEHAGNFFTFVMSQIAKEGSGPKDMMRRTIAGIIVAFLKAKLNGEGGDLEAILKDPKLAPATLDPVEHRLA